jgi:simple sugar transport system permease protein
MGERTAKIKWGSLLRMPIAIFLALFIGFLITAIFSEQPFFAYYTFLTGPVSFLNRFGDWIEDAITLTMLGLSVSIVFSANQISLGAEGQMTFGALVAGIAVLFLPLPPILLIPVAMILSMMAGFAWGAIPGLLKARLNANEIVSSLMLNYVAVKFYEYYVTYKLTLPGAGFVASEPFPDSASLGSFIPNIPFLSNLRQMFLRQTSISIALYIAIAAVILVSVMMYKMTIGYEIRVTGQNPLFAKYGGIKVTRVIFLSMALSGAFAGLAGAHVAVGIHERLLLGVAVGFGFEGVVVSLLAKNNPKWVPLAALVYAYLRTGADVMERSTDISREMVLIVQGLIILFITAERSFSLHVGDSGIRSRLIGKKSEGKQV